MARLAILCLGVLATVSYSAAQCGNSGGNCPAVTHVGQCTEDIVAQCCSKCNELAGCFNIASNCYNYSPHNCYTEIVNSNCCLTCKFYEKTFLPEGCLYGDKQTLCDASRCDEPAYAATCCGTCFTGTTSVVNQVTLDDMTTVQLVTEPPPTCDDDLANCADTVENIPSTCYNAELRDACCQSCSNLMNRRLALGVDVNVCPYGDKASFCVADDFDTASCSSNSNDIFCCDTCAGVTTPAPTTTVITTPDMCVDDLAHCANTVENVPSTCYNAELRDSCCLSCRRLMNRRLVLGIDVDVCPYGDKAGFCVADDFDPASCPFNSNHIFCCDTCAGVTTSAPTTTVMMTTVDPNCRDSGFVGCDLPSRYCYGSVSRFYADNCCETCRGERRPELGNMCLYGNKETGCNRRINPDVPCEGELADVCCETCMSNVPTTPMMTTTDSDCMDASPICEPLVGNNGRNCYDLEDTCCRSCSRFVQPDRPFECRFGDLIPSCTPGACDSTLTRSLCCATCADFTTPMPTTTESECFDLANGCMDGPMYNLRRNRERCYVDDIRDNCCQTCKNLANPDSGTCPWGDRDSICSVLQNVDCINPAIDHICCATCDAPRPTTTPGFTPPPDCRDTLSTCDQLTDNTFNCYPEISSFISNSCCETCHMEMKRHLPYECRFGNRITSCSVFITDYSLCMADERVNRDCCETCLSFQTTVEPTMVTSCPNEWSDSTCELLLSQLGDCSTIAEKCCRTCLTTTTAATTPTTPLMTTEDQCPDLFPSNVCALIITSEGRDQCYTQYMMDNCCNSCEDVVTNTVMPTTTPSCAGDQLGNCEILQGLLSSDICDIESETNLREQCCEFCMEDMTSPMTTVTTIAPDCQGNVWELVQCVTVVATSPLDEPCMDSSVIYENCCMFCAMRMGTTTQMMSTADPCQGDDPSLDCALLAGSLDVCNDASLAPLCCDYCNPDMSTTAAPTTMMTEEPTTAPPGPCSRNLETEENCLTLFRTQGGILFCATDFMVTNCCLFCSTVTVPSTTVPPSTTPVFVCQGDNPDFNCTSLDAAFDDRLCDPDFDSADDLRDGCCQYCANQPTEPPTTPEMTTAVCEDISSSAVCIALAQTGSCDTPTGEAQCCATCRLFLMTTSTFTTTTPMVGTTPECVDSPDVNCVDLSDHIDPCEGNTITLCCAFCRDRTTPQPTTMPPTLPPCLGDEFPQAVCEQRNTTNPNFCGNDTTWTQFCCEYCGQDVVTAAPTGDTTAAPGSTTAPATTSEPATVSPPAVCNGDIFRRSLCENRLNDEPDSCSDPQWYSVCCAYCNELAGARRKRSVNEDSQEWRSIDLSLCKIKDVDYCAAKMLSSDGFIDYNNCIKNEVMKDCCGYCATIPDSAVIPEGKNDLSKDSLLAKLFNL